MYRVVPWALLVLGASAVAVAGYMLASGAVSSSPSGPPPALEVENTEQDLGEVPIQQDNVVRTSIVNSSDAPARVLCVAQACGSNCCFRPLNDEPIVVPPGDTVVFEWGISVPGPGPFEASAPLYVDDNGLRTILLKVRGSGVPRGKRHEPK